MSATPQPGATTQAPALTLLAGRAFCVSDQVGDINPQTSQGLFLRDTRVLSLWRLTVDGAALEPLYVDQPAADRVAIVGRPALGPVDSPLLVRRTRSLDERLAEETVVSNNSSRRLDVQLEWQVAADLAGVLAVRSGEPVVTRGRWRAAGRELVLAGHSVGTPPVRARFEPGATVELTTAPAGARASVTVSIPPRGSWCGRVSIGFAGPDAGSPGHRPRVATRADRAAEPPAGFAAGSISASVGPELRRLLEQGRRDLAALRVLDPESGETYPAAGAPWYMTLFGRDALLSSWMALPADPGLAVSTLRALAARQGRRVDPASEEEPGRIPHEVRSGATGQEQLGPVYYGTADATPLFVIVLAAAHRWGVAREEVEALLPAADRALQWVSEYGDRDGDGFVEYQRPNAYGLVNQGWKDSTDGITFADGRRPTAPVAVAEVQGYVYAAWLGRAGIAADFGDLERARECRQAAETLRLRFDAAFWVPHRRWLALALDADKRHVDALGSNVGQCLATGIVLPSRARAVAELLVGKELFTGFGVRTLGTSMAAYNPVSYHNGSVWPHDTALAAWGLRRYGFTSQAEQVVQALVEAAGCLDGRLPELFCGFDRAEVPQPVPYPSACAPQAWAAATPFLLVRTLRGQRPPRVADPSAR